MASTRSTRARAGPSPSIHASDSLRAPSRGTCRASVCLRCRRHLLGILDEPRGPVDVEREDVSVCVRALEAQPRALRGLVCLHFHRPCAVSLSSSDTLQRLLELRLGTACELARLLEANNAVW